MVARKVLHQFESEKELIILDDIFPHLLSGFRIAEFNYYLQHIENSAVYSTGAAFKWIYEKRTFDEVKEEYRSYYPASYPKVFFHNTPYLKAKLFYIVFIENAYNHLPLINKNKTAFIFTLYPGGGFRLNQERSDNMLKTVFANPYFKKVIVTTKVTLEYLINNNFCSRDKIEFVYGVVTPSGIYENAATAARRSILEKNSLDICFVSHKYTPQGKDKGYDTFIEVAKKLKLIHDNIHFHVIGSFNESDIDVDDIKDFISFYGTLKTHEFSEIYSKMDIILSPNSSFIMAPGAFDGFPTGACIEAGLNAVALFVTDDLKQNIVFEEDKEIVIIPRDVNAIVEKINYFYSHPDKLKALGENGKARIQASYNIDVQMNPRIVLIQKTLAELS